MSNRSSCLLRRRKYALGADWDLAVGSILPGSLLTPVWAGTNQEFMMGGPRSACEFAGFNTSGPNPTRNNTRHALTSARLHTAAQ